MTRPLRFTFCLLALVLALSYLPVPAQACTAIVVGPLATTDGSIYTASAADCSDCDFRLAAVPHGLHSAGAERPVLLYSSTYPHEVSPRAATWNASNLEGTPSQLANWSTSPLIGTIPQVPHTFALFEGGAGYALLNEYGVAIGESTCPAKFVSRPRGDGGNALFDVSELTKVALERTKTARDAIALMGSLAEEYGYYGAEYNLPTRYYEAGESLMVSDIKEAWVFHITPDDTGKSAIWAAQRVPDTDITVVANVFIIREVNTDDRDNFMVSANAHDVAKRHNFWNPQRDGPHLDFSKAFGFVRSPPQSTYTNMRVWRVMTWANPNLTLDPHPNEWLDGYPFSVTPNRKLSRADMFYIYRDHFDGTQFDLRTADAGGPFGDPDRYDLADVGNMSHARAIAGEFGRAISLFRTSYTSIVRSKASLPREVGSVLYVAQQQPDSSVFVPLYIGLSELPRSLTRGSLFRYSNDSMFWAVTAVSNWVHRYYNRAVGDLRKVQADLEDFDIEGTDELAAKLLESGNPSGAKKVLHKFSHGIADKALKEYLELFPRLIARYHDGYVMADAKASRVKMKSMFYPEWWLKQVGYFSARETGGSFGARFELDMPMKWRAQGGGAVRHEAESRASWSHFSFVAGVVTGAICSVAVCHFIVLSAKGAERRGYTPIQ